MSANMGKVKATGGGHRARASSLCQPSELIGAIPEDRDVTSCPVQKLFTSQMAENNVTRLRVDCLANGLRPSESRSLGSALSPFEQLNYSMTEISQGRH